MWRRWVVAALVLGVLVGCGGQDPGASSSGAADPSGAGSPSERSIPDPGDTVPDVNGPPLTTTPPPTSLYEVQVVVEGIETPGVVTSDVGGISCPGTCSSRYPRGMPVRLTAQTEAEGQAFTGWGGACSGQGSTCMLSVDESTAVTARYAPTGP